MRAVQAPTPLHTMCDLLLRSAKGTPPFNEGTQLICKNSSKNGKDHFALVYIMVQTPQTISTRS
ncbi:hypothetical protein Syun_007167 [Stephania yunnanensis]|uniref:Uncharacterized protein n=1 Tax=Stephania yunnanensis TaxID=152371 RepID=A0AAP0Q253_9MAGN